MEEKAASFENERQGNRQHSQRWPRWRGLQARMTISYVWITVLLVLLVVILAGLVLIFVLNNWSEVANLSLGQKTGVQYAYAASLQSNGQALNPRLTFQPNQAYTLLPPGNSAPRRNLILANLTIPYVASANPNLSPEEVALLIAPNGRVVASSYPARYPINVPFSKLFPHQVALVSQALQGTSMYANAQQEVLSFTATVWGRNGKPIGAFYIQGQGLLIGNTGILLFFSANWVFIAGIIFLIFLITTPIGGLFGLLTTRGLVRRIRHLAGVTTDFVRSNYTRRVPVSGKDEIGQLEHHFNQMADQLLESTSRQQELAGQNARQAERTRISRELHDAISQDLFSIRMLAYGLQDALPHGSEVQTQAATLERTSSRMIREMRALLLELRPAHLEQLGLAEALKDLAVSYGARLEMTVTADVVPVSLPPEVEHALLRVAQEAFSNAVRHAHATHVTLTLTQREEEVSLTIRDNGEGFEMDENQRQQGLGLNSMQERIRDLHGTFLLHTAPGQGTHITVSIPQKEENE